MSTRDELVKRFREHLGGVQTRCMEGDNLAIVLCSYFDNPDQENGDNGWTEDAVSGANEVLDAVHAYYANTITQQAAEIERLARDYETVREAHDKQYARAEEAEQELQDLRRAYL